MLAYRNFKVERWRNLVDSKGPANGAANHGIHAPLVVKLDFGLGGVHIDVDAFGVQFQKQHVGWVQVAGNKALKGLEYSTVYVGAAHSAAVDKEVLVSSGFARGLGSKHKAVHVNQVRGLVYGNQFFAASAPQDGRGSLPQVARIQHALVGAVVL